MAGLKVRKGDTVQVISGKDKGVKGKVIKTLPEQNRVIVEGVNRVKRHTKPGQGAGGARVPDAERPRAAGARAPDAGTATAHGVADAEGSCVDRDGGR